jgi:hypothetical protein
MFRYRFAGRERWMTLGNYPDMSLATARTEAREKRACETEQTAPAIAMYARGKQVKIFPSWVDWQQKMWAESVASATTICIVGTAVIAEDEHIWGPLSRTSAAIHYFGRKSAENAFLTWKDASGRKNRYFIESDFADAVDMIAARMEKT